MKTKLLFLAILANLILLSGCKKDEVIADNDLTNLFSQIEKLDGMTITDAKSELSADGFRVLSQNASNHYFEFSKDVKGVYVYVKLNFNTYKSQKIYYIEVEITSTSSDSFIANTQNYNDLVKKIGQSHKLPTGITADFYYYGFDESEGESWSEMLSHLGDSSSSFFVIWENEEVDCEIEVARENTSESHKIYLIIYDGTNAPEE